MGGWWCGCGLVERRSAWVIAVLLCSQVQGFMVCQFVDCMCALLPGVQMVRAMAR